ncbi:MAG: DUF2318 domain-containing protein [Planctomycetota bacterium]|jgi:uncharacterized membrane protein|nr:DUF2318 domain-containing protein [Planctomycetota bacterium]
MSIRRFLPLVLFVALLTPVGAVDLPTVTDADLVIPQSDLSSKPRFYAAVIENFRMELIAVVAPDNTVRVVFNSCQSCGPVGYNVKGDSVVCKACGNAFKISVLERNRGGCNPIPVGENNRRMDGNNVVVPKEFLKRAKDYFSRS